MTQASTTIAPIKANGPLINCVGQLFAQDQFQNATKLFNKAKRKITLDLGIFQLGKSLVVQKGHSDQAMPADAHGIVLVSKCWLAQLDLGLLLSRLGRFAKALAHTDKIFALEFRKCMTLAVIVDFASRYDLHGCVLHNPLPKHIAKKIAGNSQDQAFNFLSATCPAAVTRNCYRSRPKKRLKRLSQTMYWVRS